MNSWAVASLPQADADDLLEQFKSVIGGDETAADMESPSLGPMKM